MREFLIDCGQALYGPRFQRDLAGALRVNERTMRRWVAGDFVPPENIKSDLLKLLRERRAVISKMLQEA